MLIFREEYENPHQNPPRSLKNHKKIRNIYRKINKFRDFGIFRNRAQQSQRDFLRHTLVFVDFETHAQAAFVAEAGKTAAWVSSAG